MANRVFILLIHYTRFTDNLQEKFYASRSTALTDLWLMLTYRIYITAGAC